MSVSPFGVLSITSICVLITMTLAMVRATQGPTVFDRILALNMFGTKTVLLICVVSFLQGRTDFLDLAVLYSLMNFIGMVALLRFTKLRSFSDQVSADHTAPPRGTGTSGALPPSVGGES